MLTYVARTDDSWRPKPARRAVYLIALLLAVVALPPPPAAADQAIVSGATSCREWTVLRTDGNRGAELWLSGLLLNLSVADGFTLDDSTLASSANWMDRFCRREPATTIGKATAVLYKELKDQRQQRAKSAQFPRLAAA